MPLIIMLLGMIGFILGIATVAMAPAMVLPAIALILVGAGEGLTGLVLMQAMKMPKTKEVTKMAKLVCQVCKAEQDVPVVHCGPGVLSACGGYLNCPAKGHTEKIDLPKHCGKPMKYVE